MKYIGYCPNPDSKGIEGKEVITGSFPRLGDWEKTMLAFARRMELR